jgi:hypothetical protein
MAAAYITIVLGLHPLFACFTVHTFLIMLFLSEYVAYTLFRAVRIILV